MHSSDDELPSIPESQPWLDRIPGALQILQEKEISDNRQGRGRGTVRQRQDSDRPGDNDNDNN